MSKAHLPPVPPENRSPHGGNNAGEGELPPALAKETIKQRNINKDQMHEEGNIRQNTHNQGYQQDR
ncbi:hypothetical protein [Muricoccus radiodurans]|uniref:hypothetical protein n=1 Tax=Muricoccus radiodurans TaxID=2231721 RepID=UPI003CE92756